MTKQTNKNIIIQELFYFLSFTVLIFFGLELIWPNFIIAYLNLNYLVILWLGVAIIYLNSRNNVSS
jgi:hypothetical protein